MALDKASLSALSQEVCLQPAHWPRCSWPALLQGCGKALQDEAHLPPHGSQSPVPLLARAHLSASARIPLHSGYPGARALAGACPLFLELHPSRPRQIRSYAKCLQTGSRKWRVYSRHEPTHQQVLSLGICGAVAWRDQILAPTEVTVQRGQDPKQAAMKTDTLLG